MARFRSIAATLLLATGPAQAGLLYKCADAAGHISIQSQACPTGSTQLWKRDADAEALPTPEQVAAAGARRERESEAARELSLKAGTSRPAQPPVPPEPPRPVRVENATSTAKGPCRRAHELAAEIRELQWLELDQGQQQRLERWVVNQCEQARTGD